MVRAVVGVVLGRIGAQVQGSLPVAAPSFVAVVIVVVLMLSVFIIDYLCVSRLILSGKIDVCAPKQSQRDQQETKDTHSGRGRLVWDVGPLVHLV